MSFWKKERLEKFKTSVDFSDTLDSGDSLSTVDSIKVTKPKNGGFIDVSSEFGSPTGSINGDKVEFTIGAATSDSDQSLSAYIVRVTVSTANGETLIATPSIDVTGRGDTAI